VIAALAGIQLNPGQCRFDPHRCGQQHPAAAGSTLTTSDPIHITPTTLV